MASPSKLASPPSKQASPSSSPAAEEEVEHIEASKALPVLKWNVLAFRNLMPTIQMPEAYGAIYPQDGDTEADAPAGMITLFTNFFLLYNLRLPVTVFVWDLLEYYRIHISQMSPLGMVRVRHFESPTRVYSFRLRDGVAKILPVPPKGSTTWKSKFFYVKKAAVACKQYFRNVFVSISKEKITVPEVGAQDWAATLQVVPRVCISQPGTAVSAHDVAE
ncbi:hypothetical protein HanPI659440_Chr02g0083841 [Helianthus annuus]|nr:hypothetical protein HanPI659440_Chr02g0083841 [Helianthus annuus]